MGNPYITIQDYISDNIQKDKYLRELIEDFNTTDNEEIRTALEYEIYNYVDEKMEKL